jgi:microsomal dipeptidase-like Zn-dependent dipeptidase
VCTIKDVVKHIVYIKDLIGIDHVGLGSDFDGPHLSLVSSLSLSSWNKLILLILLCVGVSLLPEGLENVSKYPNLVAGIVIYDTHT